MMTHFHFKTMTRFTFRRLSLTSANINQWFSKTSLVCTSASQYIYCPIKCSLESEVPPPTL